MLVQSLPEKNKTRDVAVPDTLLINSPRMLLVQSMVQLIKWGSMIQEAQTGYY